MLSILTKFGNSLETDGVAKTAKKVISYPINILKNKKFHQSVLHLNSIEDKFIWIYQKNLWGNSESVSGNGSTLKYTQNLRSELPGLFQKYDIRRIFDAPCGDFNWMKELLGTVDIDYIGGDIVPQLIASHKENYENERRKFITIDITKKDFPQADLMICRDCLFHLSYADTKSVLINYVNSNIPYLLTSTHKNKDGFANGDIVTGHFRMIDLFKSPYNFPSDPLMSIEDWVPPHIERQMCLWSHDQIASALGQFP